MLELDLYASMSRGTSSTTWKVRLELDSVPDTDSLHAISEFDHPTVGWMRTLENKVQGIERSAARAEQAIVKADKTIEHPDATVGSPSRTPKS